MRCGIAVVGEEEEEEEGCCGGRGVGGGVGYGGEEGIGAGFWWKGGELGIGVKLNSKPFLEVIVTD